MPLNGFSTAANSKVPHNALHDARALRDHIVGWNDYSAAVRSAAALAFDPGQVAELKFTAVLRLDADLAHRLAVAAVGQHDLHAAIAPLLAPLAQGQHTGRRSSPFEVSE